MNIEIFKSWAQYEKSIELNQQLDITQSVHEILNSVKNNGDSALKEYTKKFDHVTLDQIKVPEQKLEESFKELSPKLETILEKAKANIQAFHKRQKTETQLQYEEDHSILGWRVTPIDSVGIYVPGGRAIYPSTVLMNIIPAQVAQVPRIVVVSPPNQSGMPDSLVLATLYLLGIKEVYTVGGAHAIGALTFGTKSIAPVNKITGPGNAYVAEAKRQVYGKVGIDSFAGPSEILIVCNREDISDDYLIRDMLSQAEHDPEARALLLTTSIDQAKRVAKKLEQLIPSLPRKDIIKESFKKHSAIIVESSLENIFEIVNQVAPEHLELLTKQPMEDMQHIRNAGAIFLGENTPEAVGDYFAGPNHTLPTSGCAKFSSPLGVQDFVKNTSVLCYSKEKLQSQANDIIDFAEAEGLFAHAESIRSRIQNL